jgi:uncharacterized protein (DUF2132 family)
MHETIKNHKKSILPTMIEKQPNNPLHGITLERVLNSLVEHYGWRKLAKRIEIRCFINEPSVKSSLKFLRKNPWARKEVEDLYLATQKITGQP